MNVKKIEQGFFRGTLLFLNIKLLHNQSPDNYVKLLTDLVYQDYVVRLRGEQYIEMIKLKKDKVYDLYIGELVTYMGIRPNAWYNKNSKEIEEHTIAEHLYANTIKCEFYFVPQVHRLAIFATSKINIKQVKTFFDEACNRLLGPEQVHTVIETSRDAIDMILEADEITRVKISLSYSNKGFSEGFAKVLDDKAKDANLSTFDIDIQSAPGESLNMDEDGLVSSALELVQSNGTAKVTTKKIIKVKNKVKKKPGNINTADYPRKENIKGALNELKSIVYTSILSIFK